MKLTGDKQIMFRDIVEALEGKVVMVYTRSGQSHCGVIVEYDGRTLKLQPDEMDTRCQYIPLECVESIYGDC